MSKSHFLRTTALILSAGALPLTANTAVAQQNQGSSIQYGQGEPYMAYDEGQYGTRYYVDRYANAPTPYNQGGQQAQFDPYAESQGQGYGQSAQGRSQPQWNQGPQAGQSYGPSAQGQGSQDWQSSQQRFSQQDLDMYGRQAFGEGYRQGQESVQREMQQHMQQQMQQYGQSAFQQGYQRGRSEAMASAQQGGGQSSQAAQQGLERIRQLLDEAGFSNVEVADTQYLVTATTQDGRRAVLIVDPPREQFQASAGQQGMSGQSATSGSSSATGAAGSNQQSAAASGSSGGGQSATGTGESQQAMTSGSGTQATTGSASSSQSAQSSGSSGGVAVDASNAQRLIGMTVRSSGDENVGTVQDVILSQSGDQVETLVVERSEGGLLGIEPDRVQSTGSQSITVGMSRSEISNAGSFQYDSSMNAVRGQQQSQSQ